MTQRKIALSLSLIHISCHFFIGIASGTESSKRTVIQWLFFEAGCMQGVSVSYTHLGHFPCKSTKVHGQYPQSGSSPDPAALV